MVYGRGGIPVTIQRLAKIEDIKRLDARKPDKQDREALAGERTLVWADADTARDDDGSRAVASIQARHA